eukprot:TRINITY_DN3008_c0_g1_i1.p1 TRINITY_DN3008_c0_g1~~TRINITY_DN3008_c0_g1_i1.p1  ORF type:complete len:857 (+),score=199.13 TRINITY_DN3008_c0_g1_i1:50-2620(+)
MPPGQRRWLLLYAAVGSAVPARASLSQWQADTFQTRYANFSCRPCADGGTLSGLHAECPTGGASTSAVVGDVMPWLRLSGHLDEELTGGMLILNTSTNWGYRSQVEPLELCQGGIQTGNETIYTMNAPLGNDAFSFVTPNCPMSGPVSVRAQVPLGHCAPPGTVETRILVVNQNGAVVMCLYVDIEVSDHGSGPLRPCGDDEYGIVAMSGYDCSLPFMCDRKLSVFIENADSSTNVSEICKRTCGLCDPASVPVQTNDCLMKTTPPAADDFDSLFVGAGFLLSAAIVGGLICMCNRQRVQRGRQLAEAHNELRIIRERERKYKQERQEEMRAPLNAPPKPRRARGLSAVPNHWQRVQLLGKGSFGKVYLGLRPDGTFFAVKVLELTADSSTEKLEELMREVDVMSRLANAHIVEYYGCAFESQKHELHIFMEYEQGGSIGALVRRMELPLSDETASTYMQQILLGVTYLHGKDVIHRDLKGDNVLLSAEGICKLADFGTSKRVVDGAAATITGTPAWMAPEVISAGAKGAGRAPGESYTYAADIWSCGIITCELLNRGKPPWPRFESAWQAAFTIGSWSKELPPEVPEVSPLCRSFMLKCLDPAPERRPSAQSLLRHAFVRGAKVRRLSVAQQHIRTGADIKQVLIADNAEKTSPKAAGGLKGKRMPSVLSEKAGDLRATPCSHHLDVPDADVDPRGRRGSAHAASVLSDDSGPHGTPRASLRGTLQPMRSVHEATASVGPGSGRQTPRRWTLRPPPFGGSVETRSLPFVGEVPHARLDMVTSTVGDPALFTEGDSFGQPPALTHPLLPSERPPDVVVRGTLCSSWPAESYRASGTTRPPNAAESEQLLRTIRGHV